MRERTSIGTHKVFLVDTSVTQQHRSFCHLVSLKAKGPAHAWLVVQPPQSSKALDSRWEFWGIGGLILQHWDVAVPYGIYGLTVLSHGSRRAMEVVFKLCLPLERDGRAGGCNGRVRNGSCGFANPAGARGGWLKSARIGINCVVSFQLCQKSVSLSRLLWPCCGF